MQAKPPAATGVVLKGQLPIRAIKPIHLVLAAMGLLVAFHAILGLLTLRLSQEKSQVEADIAVAQRVLRASQTQSLTQLEEQLRQAEARLGTMQGTFPERVNATSFISEVLAVAQNHQVRVTSVQGRRPKEQKIGQHQYVVAPYAITVQGQPFALVDFTGALQQTQQQTLIVRTAQLGQGAQGTTLVVEVELYSRPPASPAATAAPQPQKPATPPKAR